MATRSKQFRRAAFTWFGYTAENVTHITSMEADKCDYVIIGFEVCPETGKPHIQGYIEFKSPLALSTVKSRLDPMNKGKSVVHIEPAKKHRDANITYCKKADSHDAKAIELYGAKWIEKLNIPSDSPKVDGLQPLNKGEADIRPVVEMAQTGEHTLSEIASSFPNAATKYAAGLKSIIESAKEDSLFQQFKSRMISGVPNLWQADFIGNVIDQPVNNRAVWWIYDATGGTGKSWLCDYLIATRGAIFFENAKSRDIAFAYDGQPIVIFDFARTCEGHVNYNVIECLKNGRIFSAKYGSKAKFFKPPHVICLANWPPARGSLSQDRWRIINLEVDSAKKEE